MVSCGGVWRPDLFTDTPGDGCLSVLGESKLGEYHGLLDILILWARDTTHGGKIFGRQCGEESKLHHPHIQTLRCCLAGRS